jgi:hypothetical protein
LFVTIIIIKITDFDIFIILCTDYSSDTNRT